MQFFMDNIALVSIALVSGAMLLWPLVSGRVTGAREVGSLEAIRLINQDALVLDVRENQEFAAGHVPHARHIPLGQLASRLPELEKFKDRPVVVVCRSGARSGRACAILRKNGFGQVYNLGGGMTAWEQANMPVERTSS
ncbi:MAG: rhodanese-like domain-containing protein [Pseudomonadota bacterium]